MTAKSVIETRPMTTINELFGAAAKATDIQRYTQRNYEAFIFSDWTLEEGGNHVELQRWNGILTNTYRIFGFVGDKKGTSREESGWHCKTPIRDTFKQFQQKYWNKQGEKK